MNRTETLELLIVLNVAITLAAVFYMMNPFGGFFMAVSIAFINNSVAHSTGNLLLYSTIDASTISGDQIYMYTFHVLSGLSFATMQRLPVNHVLIAISLFCLGRRLTRSWQTPSTTSTAAVMSILFLLNTTYEVGNMSFFVKGAGTFLYLLFELLLLKYSSARTTSTLAGLLILFVANNFFDYTAQVWMIATVIPFVVLVRANSDTAISVRLSNILVLMVVVFLAYRSIVYTAYLPWMTQVLIGYSIQSFVHTLPYFRDVTAYPFEGSRPFTPSIFIANTLAFAATTAVTGYYLVRLVWMMATRRRIVREDVVFASLFLPFPVTVAIYLPIGHVNLSYATLMLPILSSYCVWALTKHARGTSKDGQRARLLKPAVLLPAFVATLLVLSGISYIGGLQSGSLLVSSNSNMSADANWLLEEGSGKVVVLSDLDTLGKLLIARSSFLGGSFDELSLQYFDTQTYTNLVRHGYPQGSLGANSTPSPIYLLIDAKTNNPVSSVSWQTFEPLSRHIADVQNNPHVSQVYDDGTCLIEIWNSS